MRKFPLDASGYSGYYSYQMAKIKNLNEAGISLVNHAFGEQSRAKPGAVDTLFPYIYEASQRISTRAISRFLKEQEGVAISPAAVSKALREQKRHWQRFYSEVKASAEVVGKHEMSARSVLVDEETFEASRTRFIVSSSKKGQNDAELAKYEEACRTLRDRWFNLLPETREKCLAVVSTEAGKVKKK